MVRSKKTLYLIAGPSGSGKTQFANKLKQEKDIVCHFEADLWMVDSNGNYSFDPKKLHYCHKACQKWAEEAMKIGQDVIVSNTSLTRKEAKPYVDLAKIYKYDIEIHHMTNQYQNVHGVPDWKVEEMRKKHQFYTLEDFS